MAVTVLLNQLTLLLSRAIILPGKPLVCTLKSPHENTVSSTPKLPLHHSQQHRENTYLFDVISEEDIFQIRRDGVLGHVEIYLVEERRKRKKNEDMANLKIDPKERFLGRKSNLQTWNWGG